MKKFNEVITSASTKDQRKQLIHLLISDMTVVEIRKKDRCNKGIINYLNIRGEEGVSIDDDNSSFFNIYIKI